jgi:DNA mismatch repair protein MSH2
MLKVVAGYYPVLESASNKIAELDVLCGFAQKAQNSSKGYVRPTFSPDGKRVIKIEKCRHPCLENNEFESCVANDCSFDDENCNFKIITGPNMGGKSTYIRQVAICVLLAHMGNFFGKFGVNRK